MTSAQSRANKAKGRAFERAVADLFQEAGFLWSDRKRQRGVRDQGDVTGIEDWTLELKNEKTINLAGLVDEATVEAANAGTTWFAGIQKRRGKHARDAYVVLPLWLFIRLVKHLLGMNPPVCRDCGRAA
jgi:hypothetical protein